MRVATLVKKLIGVTRLIVEEARFEAGGLHVFVRPRWRLPRCGGCGKIAPGYDSLPRRSWKHLPIGRTPVKLYYVPRRVQCAMCGVKTEAVPWAASGSLFTRDFEEMVAYLASCTDKTTVTKLMGIAWRTVGSIVERVVSSRLDDSRFDGLRRIGVDEFSYRKHHRYLTTVVDHDARRVVWAGKGRGAETLGRFFDAVGEARLTQLEVVTMDMAGGYIKAVRERLPHAQIVFDRFHVQKLMSDALDEVRRSQVRELKGTPKGKIIKGSRFALLKNPWNLTRAEHEQLAVLQKTNKRLYRAYLLKETLADALDYRRPKRARAELIAWLAWASRSRLTPIVKTARTIRKHLDDIVAYVKYRLTNGIVEGINNRLRMIARRAFGFHSPDPLISMLFLCCGGITLDPPLPGPT